jgi:hypothetical protein
MLALETDQEGCAHALDSTTACEVVEHGGSLLVGGPCLSLTMSVLFFSRSAYFVTNVALCYSLHLPLLSTPLPAALHLGGC